MLDTECREMCSQGCLLDRKSPFIQGLTAAVVNRQGLACQHLITAEEKAVMTAGVGRYSFFSGVATDGCPCSHTRVSESNELTVTQTNRRHEENLLK